MHPVLMIFTTSTTIPQFSDAVHLQSSCAYVCMCDVFSRAHGNHMELEVPTLLNSEWNLECLTTTNIPAKCDGQRNTSFDRIQQRPPEHQYQRHSDMLTTKAEGFDAQITFTALNTLHAIELRYELVLCISLPSKSIQG